MTKRRDLRSEDGWVMVPVIVLMVIAIAVALALLAVVDQQTGQSRAQRSVDSAQTLAEGAVSATANVLATDQSAGMWPVSGACLPITGDLTAASTAPADSLAAKVTTEVQARFKDTSPDYAAADGRNTTWRVDVCPVQGTESRWNETFLARTVPVPASAPPPISMWVRGQASVRGSTTAVRPENARAVVSKVRQSTSLFEPPQNFAVGAGGLSTDISATLNSTLANTPLLGSLVSPQIANSDSKVGVRCGLLATLDDPDTTCLAGTLAAVSGVTNATGLGVLNTVLGLRNETLATWTMAPNEAIEAWRTEAQRAGVYSPASSPVPGYGDDRSKNVTGDGGALNNCFNGVPTASQVIFIEKVGDGDDYCNVPANTTAKILIVERGAMRFKGAFTGVVYALNKQECGSDGVCDAGEREDADTREVVRIDGTAGKVTGAVWADGAGGQVGIYPSLTPPAPLNVTSLLGVGGASGICSIGLVGSLVSTLDSTLGGLLDLVSGLLGNEQVRYWDGTPDGTTTSPGGCSLLKSQLDDLSPTALLNLYATGGNQVVPTTIHRTRANFLSPWGPWTTKTTSTVAVPSLLTTTLPSVVSQVAGLLSSTNYTAVQYNSGVVGSAEALMTHGAAPIVGSYRNVNSTG